MNYYQTNNQIPLPRNIVHQQWRVLLASNINNNNNNDNNLRCNNCQVATSNRPDLTRPNAHMTVTVAPSYGLLVIPRLAHPSWQQNMCYVPRTTDLFVSNILFVGNCYCTSVFTLRTIRICSIILLSSSYTSWPM